jgi:exosortase/archaeosortase family protein
VIALPGRRLLVEEACSGVHSLFVTLAAALFYGFWRKFSAVCLVVLLAATAFWAVVVNIGRIVLVTWVVARSGMDLLGGWRHEAVGLAVVVLTLGLIASTDRLYPPVARGVRFVGWATFVVPWQKW